MGLAEVVLTLYFIVASSEVQGCLDDQTSFIQLSIAAKNRTLGLHNGQRFSVQSERRERERESQGEAEVSRIQMSDSTNKSTCIVQSLKPDQISETNLIFVHIMKAGGTTACGVTRRIGAHHKLWGAYQGTDWIAGHEPAVWAVHGAMDAEEFGANPSDEPVFGEHGQSPLSLAAVQALKQPVFMWTMVREPAQRVRSLFYWAMENSGVAAEDASLELKLAQLSVYGPKGNANTMFRYLRSAADDTIDDLFERYGVIGVTERFEESVVVLAALLKVSLSDVLYVASKNSTTGFVDRNNLTHGAYPSLSEEPDEIQNLVNNEFKEWNSLDYALYEEANRRLNSTIARMNLQPAIDEFRKQLATAQATCGDDCTMDSGYVRDQGCSYKCLDNLR